MRNSVCTRCDTLFLRYLHAVDEAEVCGACKNKENKDLLDETLARLTTSENELRDVKKILKRVLDSVAILPNDGIYRPETVRYVLLDEIGQECERILGAAGKPCFDRWEEAGYEVEWDNATYMPRGDLPPAYVVLPRGVMGVGPALARLGSVEDVDAWIVSHPVKP